MSKNWIPLLNYSTKYGVSLSTLRRRIKAHGIPFKLDQGKYLLPDEAADGRETTPANERPSSTNENVVHENQRPLQENSKRQNREPEVSFAMPTSNFVEASVLSSAHRLVEEIKSAYAKILQEKEEQIGQLKEELVDLRMLVRILEERPRRNSEPQNRTDTKEVSDDFSFDDFQTLDV